MIYMIGNKLCLGAPEDRKALDDFIKQYNEKQFNQAIAEEFDRHAAQFLDMQQNIESLRQSHQFTQYRYRNDAYVGPIIEIDLGPNTQD